MAKKKEEITLIVSGMTCNSCSATIERSLNDDAGVERAIVNFATEKARIFYDKDSVNVDYLIDLIDAIGYDASLAVDGQDDGAESRKKDTASWQLSFYIAMVFTTPIVLLMIGMDSVASIKWYLNVDAFEGVTTMTLLVLLLSTPVQFFSGHRFHAEAWKGLKNKVLGMSFLVSMGSNAAYFYGLFSVIRGLLLRDSSVNTPDFFMTCAMLISFVLLGKYMESVAKAKTSQSMSKLLDLQVKSAIVVQKDSDGNVVQELDVPIDMVQKNDILKVVGGSSIPADGIVVWGNASVDESMLTGEAKPVKKDIDDQVMGATISTNGLFHMRVTGVGSDTALSKIVKLVEDAQLSKAPIQAYADYIASIFVPTVVFISTLTFVVWYIMCTTEIVHKDWIPATDSVFVFAFNFAIATLVIACPCALGLATPTAVMVGTGIGAEHGVLIKGGEALETAHKINTVLFDKTGTLTYGKPIVTDVKVFTEKRSKDDIVYFAACAETGSEHPLGKAIVSYAKYLKQNLEHPTQFHATTGRGISCHVQNCNVLVGNLSLMKKKKIDVSDIDIGQFANHLSNQGKTALYLAIDGKLSAILGVADAPRDEAIQALRVLREMDLDIWMVTGDHQSTAKSIGHEIGIDVCNIISGALPEEKVQHVRRLQNDGRVVAMVGDGINDSPALAQANLGIAIGAGTEVAIETAQMVLMKSSLLDVITAIDLSRTIFKRIRLNYVWALGYNSFLIPLAAGALYPFGVSIPPMFAGGAMALSSVTVVTSSLLLRYYRPPAAASVQGGKSATELSPLLSV